MSAIPFWNPLERETTVDVVLRLRVDMTEKQGTESPAEVARSVAVRALTGRMTDREGGKVVKYFLVEESPVLAVGVWHPGSREWEIAISEKDYDERTAQVLKPSRVRGVLMTLAGPPAGGGVRETRSPVQSTKLPDGRGFDAQARTVWNWRRVDSDDGTWPEWSGSGETRMSSGGKTIGSGTVKRRGSLDPHLGWFREVESELETDTRVMGVRAHVEDRCRITLDPQDEKGGSTGGGTGSR